jgi:hypothetical protein
MLPDFPLRTRLRFDASRRTAGSSLKTRPTAIATLLAMSALTALLSSLGGCASGPPAKPDVVEIVKRWGTGSADDDHRLFQVLDNSANACRGCMDEHFLLAIRRRVQDQPEVLHSFAKEWLNTRGDCEDAACMKRLHGDMVRYTETHAAMAHDIIIVASVFDRPELLYDLEWDDVPRRWKETVAWLGDNLPNAELDKSTGRYVVRDPAGTP